MFLINGGAFPIWAVETSRICPRSSTKLLSAGREAWSLTEIHPAPGVEAEITQKGMILGRSPSCAPAGQGNGSPTPCSPQAVTERGQPVSKVKFPVAFSREEMLLSLSEVYLSITWFQETGSFGEGWKEKTLITTWNCLNWNCSWYNLGLQCHGDSVGHCALSFKLSSYAHLSP